MKNKHTAGIISTAIVLAEFIAFLIWGLNIQAGDEMGYGMIVFYIAFPITALILSTLLAAKKSPFFFPVALLAVIAPVLLSFFIFGTVEIIMGVFTLIPCAIGGIIGLIINKIKNK